MWDCWCEGLWGGSSMSWCGWLMQVNWDYMDKELLEKFWASSDLRQEIRKNLPDCMAVSCGLPTQQLT